MARIYFYKLVADNGGAPCLDGKQLLSLAICKPAIRKTAEEGDLIFGFAANSLHKDNRLIYVAKITRKLSEGEYFKKHRYFRRGDCIYRFKLNRYEWQKSAKYHGPKDLTHDLGKYPRYRRAHVLLSEDFRYFGKNGRDEYKSKFGRVKQAVENLGRGHRVRLKADLRRELLEMKRWIWKTTRKKIAGTASSAPSRKICLRGGYCGSV